MMIEHQVKVLFASSDKIGSRILEFFLFSKFSHTGLEIDGVVYEARLLGGVQATDYKKFRNYYGGHYEEYVIPCTYQQKIDAKAFSKSQLGRKYDLLGVFAFPFRVSSWQSPNKWFCSEYNAAALVRSGIIDIKQKLSRVSPRDLWILITNRRK